MFRLPFSSKWVLAVLLAVAAHGCGESDSVVIVKRSPADRPDVDKTTVSRGSLNLPAAQPFNYVSYTSAQVGDASRGESAAVGKDAARCSAKAADTGSAWGEMQVGYCFDNMTGGPLNGAVHLRFDVVSKQTSKGPTEDDHGNLTTAKSHLHFLIKDSAGLSLKNEALGESTLAKGPSSWTNKVDTTFDARFEPERGYYLVLAGRTDAQAAKGADVEAAIEIKNLSLEIAWRPAEPQVKTAGSKSSE
ncbi:MAG TPA: hypothetical protein VMV81_00335 [Phycisphaerae bacterium]|nr:hypothetical protein [Phycisphaerae bacterium]